MDGEPRYTYFLHDHAACVVLVRRAGLRQGVRISTPGPTPTGQQKTDRYKPRIVHILATGVFFTGFIKDMFSLPRPLSPPLHRITMSGSAALEYGFPSTHSANAVSVAVYSLLKLREHSAAFSPSTALALEVLAYFYAVSIVFGRLYCGMHGFLDVITGSALGALISLIEFYCAPWIEDWLQSSSYLAPLTIVLFILLFVRIHPEPADDCPCFDDSVSFAGVMIGLELGTWRFARYSPLAPVYVGTNPTFDLSALTWPVALGRIVLGIAVIVSWREVMKPTLLKLLPHLYRVFETYGLSLPRKFFTPASKYKDVPLRGLKDDNVLPHVADVAKAVKSIRGPGRGRAVSVGPQSAADAYETLAWRERKRRESLSRERNALKSKKSVGELQKGEQQVECRQVSGVRSGGRKEEFEQGEVVEVVSEGELELEEEEEEEEELLDEKDVFSRVVKPRVRYDVEVVTKLVVYAGEYPFLHCLVSC